MHVNDNRTLLEDYFRSQHPQMYWLPDYGLQLSPEFDAKCRAHAEKHGVDYDRIKRRFLWSHQVIPERHHKMGLALMDKNAIPINALQNYFEGMISGAILHQQEKKAEANKTK